MSIIRPFIEKTPTNRSNTTREAIGSDNLQISTRLFLCSYRSSPPEVFLGKCVLKICSKYAWEHPCRSMISVKLLCNFTEITLLHGCSSVNLLHIFQNTFSQEHRWRAAFAVISDLFGVWKALAIETFNHRIKEIVAHFNNNYVKMPEFYVYISSKRRSFNGFKHQYSVSTVAFVGYSKRFLDLAIGAPGSTHDAFWDIQNSQR